jgi:adenosylcobinamide-GDP ribazoletransferase
MLPGRRCVMRDFIQALGFLTRLPIPLSLLPKEPDLGRAVPFFPLVGLILGAVVAAFAYIISPIFTPLTSAVILVSLMVYLSGGLHLDGIADTADGFLSCRERDDMMRIMKDPSCGAMGVIALIVVLMLKTAFLSELLAAGTWAFIPGLIIAALAGRSAQILGMCIVPYAKKEGLGAMVWSRKPWFGVGAMVILAAVSFTLCLIFPAFKPSTAIMVLILVLASSLVWGRICMDKLGGGTGDTLGAISEITEVIVIGVVALGQSG